MSLSFHNLTISFFFRHIWTHGVVICVAYCARMKPHHFRTLFRPPPTAYHTAKNEHEKKIRMTFALPLICMFLFIITKCSSSVIVTFFFLLPRRTEFEITLIMFIFVVVHVCANVISGTHTPAAPFVRFKRKYNVQLLSVRDMRMVMLVPSEWFMYVFICDTSSLCALFNTHIFQVVHAFA